DDENTDLTHTHDICSLGIPELQRDWRENSFLSSSSLGQDERREQEGELVSRGVNIRGVG
ncbi:MAG: hypothetical protein QXZ00_04010, partial [Nitrososphaerota archaeon]